MPVYRSIKCTTFHIVHDDEHNINNANTTFLLTEKSYGPDMAVKEWKVCPHLVAPHDWLWPCLIPNASDPIC